MTIIKSKVSRYAIPFCVYLLSLSLLAQSAQAAGSASTLPGQSPGAPVGSFRMSEFDSVNLFNGHLNFYLPILDVGGRGQASFSLGLPIDHRWMLLPTAPDTPDVLNPAYLSQTSLTPGFLRARHLSEGCQYGVFFETQTHTILTFTTPNGSEIELRDDNFFGLKTLSQCNQFDPGAGMANRGRTFSNVEGSVTFISDTNIFDMTQAVNPIVTKPSGYILTKEGARYRVSEGEIRWLRDRNGNLLNFTYESSGGRLTGITDSLNRQVTIAYTGAEHLPHHKNITFKGFGGAPRTINIEYANLSDLLVEGTISTYQGLFGIGTTEQFNPWLVKLVRLPDNRTYQMRYNKYGELSRVEVPTGAVFTYQWASGNPQNANGLSGKFVDRRVIKKSVYKDATTLVGSTSFGLFETDPSGTSGSAKMRQLDQFDSPLTDERHYFFGVPIDNINHEFGYLAPPIIGRDYKTDYNTANGATLLRRVERFFDGTGINIIQTLTTLADVSPNLIAKKTFTYDSFFNVTDTYEYDFGQGVPGPFLRRTHTSYVTNPTYTGTNLLAVYAGTAAHLRSLPEQQWVSSDTAGNNKKSLTVFEYDNYSVDTLHAALTPRANISGLCTTFDSVGICSNVNPASYTTRGNVTTATSYSNASAQTGPVTIASQFDVAGNVVKSIDARGFGTQFSFGDCYGTPDANAQNCTGAAELGAAVSYAFATTATNPLNHVSRTQFDYYLGRPVDAEDPNNVVTSVHYDDALERTKKIVRAANQGASVKSQTLIEYDDVNRMISTSADLNTFDDRVLVSKVLYDGLGRTIEKRMYEGGSNYIVMKTEYDAMSRPLKSSNPFRPLQGETALWTTLVYDALGRVVSSTTPDNAVVNTGYSGNTVTVTDQVSKTRKTVTDGLGRLTQVSEDPSGTPLLTSYEHDVLDNLTKVTQDNNPQSPQQPPRVFVYDSLRRLTSTTSPESGTVIYQYDANTNITQKTDARGIVANYVYDALNRHTTVDYSDTGSINPDVTLLYDGATKGKGQVWQAFAGGSESVGSTVEKSIIDSFDALGRPLVLRQLFKVNGVWSAPYQVSRAYNLAGGVTVQTYPSNRTVTYNYDAAGRVADKDASNLAFTGNLGDGLLRTYSRGVTYASAGQLKQEQFGTTTPVYNKLFYNSRLQLAEILASTTGGDNSWNRGKILNQYSLQCSGAGCNGTDNNGNLRKQEVFIPGNDQVSSFTSWYQQYDYDALNRLLRVHEYTGNPSLDWQQEYVYDRWGNRKVHQTNTFGTGIPKPNFGVSIANNRLTAPAGSSMTYDSAGNLTNDTYTGAGNRTYNGENKITSAWGGNNQAQFYTYDAAGQRVRRKIDGQETWQIYGFDSELLAEYAASGETTAPKKEYGYRNGQLLITAEATSGGGGGGSGGPTVQNVTWTNLVGLSASGNNLTRTAAGDGWNAGAVSTQSIASGDGYAEFTATETNKRRSVGLTDNTTVTSMQYIDYGIYLSEDGQIAIHEGLSVYGNFGTYVSGDKFRVSIESGVVKYRKNGTLLRTSTLAPTYPLYAGGAIFTNAGTVTNAVITAVPSVTWTNLVGVSASGSNLTRTAAGDGWNSGAVSTQSIASGDGHAEFTATETNKRRTVGLTDSTTVTGMQNLRYGIYLGEDGQIAIHEGLSVYGAFGTYVSGDKLRVAIEAGVVKYRKNGTLLRTSTLAPTYPLYAGAAIFSNGGTVTNAVITAGPSVTWINAVGVSPSGSNLTRTAAGDGWNSGAVSSQSIASGDGYAEFTATETNKRRSVGLTDSTTVTAMQHIDYGVYLSEDGQIAIHEGLSVYGNFGTYVSGDKLRVAIEGGVVKYRKNGTLLRTSTLAPTYPLYAGAAIFSNGGTVTNAVLSSGGGSSSTQVLWLVPDHLGTPRMIIDQTGSLANVKRHDYLPFGEELVATQGLRSTSLGYSGGDGIRQQFTEKERDLETGLDYFIARYYSSAQGRFLSVDPLTASAQPSDPQSFNRYSYTLNNPLRFVDPLGRNSQDPDVYKPEFKTCTVGVDAGCSESMTVVGAVTIRSGPDQAIVTTSTVLASLPGSPESPTPPGADLIEEVVSDTTQKMLELAAGVSEVIGDTAYAALPDFFGGNINLPLLGGVDVAITKDLEVFVGGNLFGITGGQLEGATSEKPKLRLSGQVGFGYFLTTETITPEQRMDYMEGTDLNISLSYATVQNQLDGAGPPALIISGPGGYGVSTTTSTHAFSLRSLIGKEPIRKKD